MKKVPGIVCLVAGIALLYWGYHMSQSAGGQFNDLIHGSPGNKPLLCYIGGGILVLAGLGQISWKGKS